MQTTSADNNLFWGTISTEDHVVYLYDNQEEYLSLLTDYVTNGIQSNECVVVLATSARLAELESRLKLQGLNVFDLKLSDQFIALEAEAMLERFMIREQPDPVLFNYVFSLLQTRARKRGRKIRAFGEMVVALSHRGQPTATIQLEQIWDELHRNEPFCLLCAYPKSIFDEQEEDVLSQICSHHTKVIVHTTRDRIHYAFNPT